LKYFQVKFQKIQKNSEEKIFFIGKSLIFWFSSLKRFFLTETQRETILKVS